MDISKIKNKFQKILHFIASVISWTVFTLLILCLALLLYYFVCTKLLATKGDKYEPFFSLYTIISPSMTPNINVYDVIVNLKVKSPDDISIGDVITFVSKSPECLGATVTHRVIGIEHDDNGKISYQTKGDANLISDSALAPYENVIGKVSYRIPKLGRVQFFLASKLGWLLLLFFPAFYILLRSLINNIKKYINIDKFSNKHWFKVLNKPLLTGKKMKLLPEPKQEVINIENMKIQEEKNDNEKDIINDLTQVDFPILSNDNIKTEINDDLTQVDLPILSGDNLKKKTDNFDDDSTQVDLPILKK